MNGNSIFIDSFNGGKILTANDCRDLLRERYFLHKLVVHIFRAPIAVFSPDFLKPCSPNEVFIRMVGNLKSILYEPYKLNDLLDVLLMFKPASDEVSLVWF